MKGNYERENLMHIDCKIGVKRRKVLLVNGIFNYRIKLAVLGLGMCLFFKVASNDKYSLNSLAKIDSPPFQLLK